MIENKQIIMFIYIALVGGGFVLEVLVTKLHYRIFKKHYKVHHFTFGKYLFLLLAPFAGMMYAIKNGGSSLWLIFLIFAIVCTVLEWFLGWAYYQIEGQRLWTYHRYAIGKYTSFLSIPIWG